jgi:hypothetical protein
MRLTERLRLRKNRKTALLHIADYYLYEEQRQANVQPNYVAAAPSSRVAPGDPVYNSTIVDPTAQIAPPAPTQVTTEPDPELTKSVNQLVNELDNQIPPPRTFAAPVGGASSLDPRMNVIRRRAGL